MKIVIEVLNEKLEKDLLAVGFEDLKFFIAGGLKCKEEDINVTDYNLQNRTKEEVSRELFNIVAKDYLK